MLINFKPCINTTADASVQCAPQDEIDHRIADLTLDILFETEQLDMKNMQEPIQKFR